MTKNDVPWKAYVNDKQAAQQLGVSAALLRKWRRVGGGPPFRVLGSRLVRYSLDELDEWARSQKREARQ